MTGWAPRGHDINELLRRDYDDARLFTPYTEWYENSLRFADSPVAEYHRRAYGARSYASFADRLRGGAAALGPGRVGAALPPPARATSCWSPSTRRLLPVAEPA